MLFVYIGNLGVVITAEWRIMSAEPMEQTQHDGQIQDGSGYFSKESMENVLFKEDRVIRKAKRTIKRSPSKEDGVVTHVGILNNLKGPVPFSKNSRKSRNGYGRGQPKKGGN